MSLTIRFIVLTAILSGVLIYQLLIFAGVVDFTHIYGGRLTDHNQMRRLVLVSILLLASMITIIYLRYQRQSQGRDSRLLHIICLILGIYFLFNTAGKIMSTSMIEKYIFGPLTLTSAFLLLTWKKAAGS